MLMALLTGDGVEMSDVFGLGLSVAGSDTLEAVA
jgi:hypothetical protein